MVDTAADDPAQLYYSSGTTGIAKGILHAHRYLLAHEEFEFCHDVRDGELFHGSGEWAWAAGICPLLGPWRYGAVQLVYARKGGYDPEEHLRLLVEARGGEHVHDAHGAARDDAAWRTRASGTRSKLRIACSAGEPLNPEVIRWFRDQFGITVLDYYGLTESYPLCGNFPTVEVREGSMGRPMPGWDVAILDEDEQPLPPGERGEICLRARSNPHYPIGYWNRPEDTEEVFGGEWFHTKDAAEKDEDGYVWYAGRADDVIISAGYRIGPFEVESACVEHPAVLEAAAVASPDERRGNIVKAFIVLGRGNEPSDELADEIKRHVRERHSAYAYPREIEFVDDLPKTLTGKIRRVGAARGRAEHKRSEARASASLIVRRGAPRVASRNCPRTTQGGAVSEVVTVEGYAVANLDDLGEGPGFRKIRCLGVTAFGVNAIVDAAGIESGRHFHDSRRSCTSSTGRDRDRVRGRRPSHACGRRPRARRRRDRPSDPQRGRRRRDATSASAARTATSGATAGARGRAGQPRAPDRG